MNIPLAAFLTFVVAVVAPVLLYVAGLLISILATPILTDIGKAWVQDFFFGGIFLIPSLWGASFWPLLLGFSASLISPTAGYAVAIALAGPTAWLVVRGIDGGMLTVGGFHGTTGFLIAAAMNTALILYLCHRFSLFSRI